MKFENNDIIVIPDEECAVIEPDFVYGPTGEGISNYNDLSNKPSINGKIIEGNNNLEYYGIKTELNQFNEYNELQQSVENKQDKLIAGKNTTITNNTIDVDVDVNDIPYDNNKSVKEVLDELLYKPISGNMTGGGTYEIGSIIQNVNLKWNLSKTPLYQSLNNNIGVLDNNIRQYVLENQNIKDNITYILTANDDKRTINISTTINFMHKRYWGVNNKDILSNGDILKLSSEFSSNRKQSRVFDCSGGKYFYFVIPEIYCNGISFKINGLAFSAIKTSTIQFTNSSNYTTNYNVYRSADIQTGSSINVDVL